MARDRSRADRQLAEAQFTEGRNTAIVCTSTMELGIDVGDLDLVMQVDAPATVAAAFDEPLLAPADPAYACATGAFGQGVIPTIDQNFSQGLPPPPTVTPSPPVPAWRRWRQQHERRQQGALWTR